MRGDRLRGVVAKGGSTVCDFWHFLGWFGFERGGIVKTLAFLSRNILLLDLIVSPFHGDFV